MDLPGTFAMMARWFFAFVVSATLAGSGCCCLPRPCGPCGPRGGACCMCLPCLPPPIVWRGGCNECGPSPCEPCGDCCNECGILPFFRRGLTCGKGCGEIYVNEWVSDPPDCCDPCDKCYGQWTGAQGPCCLGPFQRILAAFHGYSYCQRPYAGPWCPPCGKPVCGPTCGPDCGGEMAHGADIYYEGPTTRGTHMVPHIEGKSILEENWDVPRARPEPGKPIHKAEQPSRPQMTRRAPPAMPQMASRPQQQLGNRQPIGTGVRQANYEP